jgi:F-type H+-transporting ATPase subunit b
MITLISFAPFQPTPGLAFWSLVIFLLFWALMAKFAFRPIAEALKIREHGIQDALDEAKKARHEMSSMKAENEKLLVQAREERTVILNEAKEAKNKIISDAKEQAKAEANKILQAAQSEVENQKKAAMVTLKGEVGTMALDIAEKVIRKELKNDSSQRDFVNSLVGDLKLN